MEFCRRSGSPGLKDVYIKSGELLEVSGRFQANTGMRNIVGTVDRCHIPIPMPSQNEHAYVNSKHTHSINLMCVCVMMLEVVWMYESDGQGQFMIQEYLKTALSPTP